MLFAGSLALANVPDGPTVGLGGGDWQAPVKY